MLCYREALMIFYGAQRSTFARWASRCRSKSVRGSGKGTVGAHGGAPPFGSYQAGLIYDPAGTGVGHGVLVGVKAIVVPVAAMSGC